MEAAHLYGVAVCAHLFSLFPVTVHIARLQVMEMEAEEALRRAEIAQADRDSSHKFNREVRREKSHWRITSNRKNVILRNRPRYQAILAQVRAHAVVVLLARTADIIVAKSALTHSSAEQPFDVRLQELNKSRFSCPTHTDEEGPRPAVRQHDLLRAARAGVGRRAAHAGEDAGQRPAQAGRGEPAQNVRHPRMSCLCYARNTQLRA
jgi:hypothetical protein